MGTNFYVRGARHSDDDPQFHVGKRSAAGLFCWDCMVTLCAGGNERVHDGVFPWHESCPKCGQGPTNESMKESAAGRELGFNDTEPREKRGVRSCSSFSWAMSMEQYAAAKLGMVAYQCPECGHEKTVETDDDYVFEDEYGKVYTSEEFSRVIDECPIQFRDGVGGRFS